MSNIGSFDFRTDFLKTYNLRYIFDFTHLSRFLFGKGKGDHPTLAVYVKNEPPTNNDILHLTVRRTKSIKEKIWFELDKYDFHYVSREIALSNKNENKLVWKSNFLGGGRIHFLMSRLARMRTLEEFVHQKKGWSIQEGYILSKKSEIVLLKEYKQKQKQKKLTSTENNKLEKFEKKYKFYRYKLEAKNFDEKTGIKKINYLNEYVPEKEVFKVPHLLIKEVAQYKLPVVLRNNDYELCFENSITGIHAPSSYIFELELLKEHFLKHNVIYIFYISGYSGRYIVNKSTSLLKDDIDNLPYPYVLKKLELSGIEQILVDDVLNYLLEYRRQYGKVTKVEKPVSEIQLEQFAETYLKILNSIYEEYKAADWKETDSHIIFPFYHGKKSEIPETTKDLEKHLNQLLINEYPVANLRMIRVLTVYDNNVIYLIKPKQLRYWLRSVAIRDADETFAEFVEDEYNL